MKKIICLLLAVLFVFASCGNPTEADTTEKSTVSEAEIKTVSAEESILQTTYSNEEPNDKTSATVISATKEAISHLQSTNRQEEVQNSSPIILYFDLSDLQEIKQAYETMNPDDFMVYMETEKTNIYMTGFEDYESSGNMLKKLSSTTIPLLDGNPDNFPEQAYYPKNDSVDSLVFFDDNKRFIVSAENAETDSPKGLKLDSESEIISEKAFETDAYSATIYEVSNDYYAYFATVEINDSYIVMRSMGIDSVEDFEECFKRLQFVKIGDLLEQTDTAPEEPSSSEE